MTIGSGNAAVGQIVFSDSDATNRGRVYYDHSSDHLALYANGSERMRIDSSGNLLVGKSATGISTAGAEILDIGRIRVTCSANSPLDLNRLASGGTIVAFRQDNTTHGSISISGSTTSYNTSSDERLKTNVKDAGPTGDLIDAIKVRSFDWEAEGDHQRYGHVAQELEKVFPEAVHTDDSEEKMKSVDYSKLVPVLLKEIQDLRKRMTEVENK